MAIVSRLKCDSTAYKYCLEKKDTEFKKKCYINANNGYGVFTEVTLKKGHFICAYFGELISLEEGEKREDIYEENKGSYIFFLDHKRLKYCIEATNTECIGNYINDIALKSTNAII
ncbi:histone-lysine N-methyltransferase Su(var)3-9-like [Hydra vulgaris]|uniref:histone-lysine N-methyltransferase Su(var)3-9-like n=1 Tax=Hydra vulgaris TaxID=6087 RepID=UPI0032EA5FEA